MSSTPEASEEIRRLFQRHVPEIADGSVQIVGVARAIGRRSFVAVRSLAEHVDPVGACTGPRGIRLKAMVDELAGEYLTVIRWDESLQRFIQNAFGGHPRPEVTLDEATRTAFVSVVAPMPHPPDTDLLGQLVGWQVRLSSPEGNT